ncbi:uncharacterized protein LOC134856577 [Symsagittifera roscoffensis]|uniref:uncharacterized protein LOC134856577 n=1 Tax=Symsagittifera roscoffensis TaxID=84072 RepID=UPI00307BF68B
MATAASGVQLGVPDVVVDEEMSHNTDLVPDFDQEREMYGKPRRVKMGDLEKYVTANYKEAQSNSVSDNLEMVPTPLQNENSMQVHLSKSFSKDVSRSPNGSRRQNETTPQVDQSGDSLIREAEEREAEEVEGERNDLFPKNNSNLVPDFLTEQERYGPAKVANKDMMLRVTSNFSEAITPRGSPNVTADNPGALVTAENSMKVELSFNKEENVEKKVHKGHKKKLTKSKSSKKTLKTSGSEAGGSSSDRRDSAALKPRRDDEDGEGNESTSSKLKAVACCIK